MSLWLSLKEHQKSSLYIKRIKSGIARPTFFTSLRCRLLLQNYTILQLDDVIFFLYNYLRNAHKENLTFGNLKSPVNKGENICRIHWLLVEHLAIFHKIKDDKEKKWKYFFNFCVGINRFGWLIIYLQLLQSNKYDEKNEILKNL